MPEFDADAEARREERLRYLRSQREPRWLTTGWGAVGVRWCGRCLKRFEGAAYVYDDVFGMRLYFCGRCYRRDSDLHAVAGVTQQCEVCGREFAWIGGQVARYPYGIGRRPRPRTHICSETCRRERRNRARRVLPHEKRRCAGCSRSFVPKRTDQQLYHSAACKQRAYRKRQGETTAP